MTIVEKWGRTGLLKDLDEEEQKDLAQKLEDLMCNILKATRYRDMSPRPSDDPACLAVKSLSNVMFPLQRKVREHKLAIFFDGNDDAYNRLELRVNDKRFMSIEKYLRWFEEMMQRGVYHTELDAEVDFVNMMASEIEIFATGKLGPTKEYPTRPDVDSNGDITFHGDLTLSTKKCPTCGK